MNPNVLDQTLLKNIFVHLPPSEMRNAARVCRQWKELAEDRYFKTRYFLDAGMILARPWEYLKTQTPHSFSLSYQGRVAVWNGRFAGQFLRTITVKSYLSEEVIYLPFSSNHTLVDIQYRQDALVVASQEEVTIYQGKRLEDVVRYPDLSGVNAVKLQEKRLVWGTQWSVTLISAEARQDIAWRAPVTAVTCDAVFAFFGDLDGRVMKWGADVVELACHQSKVMALDVSCETLVSGSFDHTVCVIDTGTFTVRHLLTEHTKAVMSVRIYHNLCISGSLDQTVRIWDLAAHYQTMNPRKRPRVSRAALIQTLETGKAICQADVCGSLLVASSGHTYPTIYDFTPSKNPPARPPQLLPRPPEHLGAPFLTE